VSCNILYLEFVDKNRKVAAIDFFGAFLALAGSALLVLALTWAGGEYAWQSAHVVATLVIGAVVSVCFILWQWKGTNVPLVPSKSPTLHECLSM
jgi:sugar phosphate permease